MVTPNILFIDSDRLEGFPSIPLGLACRSIAGEDADVIFPTLDNVIGPVFKIISITFSKNKRDNLDINEVEKLESTYFKSCIEGVVEGTDGTDNIVHFIYMAFKIIRNSADLKRHNDIFLLNFITLSLQMNNIEISKSQISSVEKHIRKKEDSELFVLLLSL